MTRGQERPALMTPSETAAGSGSVTDAGGLNLTARPSVMSATSPTQGKHSEVVHRGRESKAQAHAVVSRNLPFIPEGVETLRKKKERKAAEADFAAGSVQSPVRTPQETHTACRTTRTCCIYTALGDLSEFDGVNVDEVVYTALEDMDPNKNHEGVTYRQPSAKVKLVAVSIWLSAAAAK